MNPPHPNTPKRSTKLFFPLALVFCQRCLAFSDGGLSSEQYHRHQLMAHILNQLFKGFKPTVETKQFHKLVLPVRRG